VREDPFLVSIQVALFGPTHLQQPKLIMLRGARSLLSDVV
jgi:hypothetical protein